MNATRNKFSPEFRDRAVRMVDEHRGDYPSEWATMSSIAGKVGCTTETLRRWCREEASRRAGPAAQAASDRDRVKALEREVKELRRANEILRKASAYFAQAELDRQGKW
jgi:transposase-like protein